jgi:ATP-binding cassette subfamily B (MDR/TAP) protein 1
MYVKKEPNAHCAKKESLLQPKANVIQSTSLSGVLYAFVQSSMYWSVAGTLWVAGVLVFSRVQSSEAVLTALYAIIVMATSNAERKYGTFGRFNFDTQLFQVSELAPDLTKGKIATGGIFSLLERSSPIDYMDQRGNSMQSVSGDLELIEARFSYPARPTTPILNGVC